MIQARLARLLVLAALSVFLQASPTGTSAQQAERNSREPIPTDVVEEVEVMLFQLNFLAQDRSGDPVTDLSADEIRILDQGMPQEIAYFEPYYRLQPAAQELASSEKRESALPSGEATVAPPSRGRWIVLFFDNYASLPTSRLPAIEAAQSYVDERLQPEDLVCVVSFTGELHIFQGFTRDRFKLKNALQRVSQEIDRATGDRYDELELLMEAMERCKGALRPSSCASSYGGGYEYDRKREADTLLRALTQLLRSLAAVSEPKLLVMFSNGFARSSVADVVDAARVVLGDDAANGMFLGDPFEMDRWFDELVTAAVTARTSIFTISSGTSGRNFLISAERGSALDEATNPYQIDVYSRSDRNHQAALADMAQRTGGSAVQKADVDRALEEILALSSGLYTVGYYPSRSIPSAPHDVKIKIKRRGVKAIWPRDVPPLPNVRPLVGDMALEPGVCSEEQRRTLTIKLRLDINSLMFESLEERFYNNFSVLLSILDDSGTKNLHRDYRFFNINYSAEEYRMGGRIDPVIEQTLIVPCRELIVRASAVDAVSGARIDLEELLQN